MNADFWAHLYCFFHVKKEINAGIWAFISFFVKKIMRVLAAVRAVSGLERNLHSSLLDSKKDSMWLLTRQFGIINCIRR